MNTLLLVNPLEQDEAMMAEPVAEPAPRRAQAKAAARPKLGPHDWIMAGFAALVEGGPDAIRVEALARDLGATKGSFYWHFKDLRGLHSAMLQAFEQLATTEITTAVRRVQGGPRAQLMRLVAMVSNVPDEEIGGSALEPSLREWGRTDVLARATMERVDAQRLADLCGLFGTAGLDSARAAEGAVCFYGALLGLESLRITCGMDMAPPLAAIVNSILGPEETGPD